MGPFETDIVIIGGGLAGTSAAIEAQKKVKKILIISKGELFESGSSFSNFNRRWGITWAESETEKRALAEHINILSKGSNIPELTKIVVDESVSAFETLLRWRVEFIRDERTGYPRRFLPCFYNKPLASIILSCKQAAKSINGQLNFSKISVLQHTRAEKILTRGGNFHGIMAKQGRDRIMIRARAGILATGGSASLHQRHITEPGLTGDGYRLLEEVGIELSNMKYVQRVWEDISLSKNRFSIRKLESEEYIFKTSGGRTISLWDIDKELIKSRQTHVPISNLQSDRKVDQKLMRHCTPEKPIQVINRLTQKTEHLILPHAQASNGGVVISEYGETSLPGLFAAGEVTTGMHGGDRVGGMMIANCIVFGTRAGASAADF